MANVGNWLFTRAVPDFLVMPWATVNLADLLIVTGAAVICAGWGARVLTHLVRRTRPVMRKSPPSRVLTPALAPISASPHHVVQPHRVGWQGAAPMNYGDVRIIPLPVREQQHQ
jgi:hypothetical protein